MFNTLRSLPLVAALACCSAVAAYAQPQILIDIPGPMSGPFLGLASFSGWALDLSNPVSQVTILVDGVPVGTTKLTVARPDVCAVYPSSPDCPIVGWTFTLDTTQYSSGTHLLEARVTSSSGEHATVSSSFKIDNWTAGTDEPITISIDTPNGSSNTVFKGVAAFAGWAISDVAAIASVSLAVDNVFITNATYGASRPDVCTAFPKRPGCPNVGWNALIDTTQLLDGTHTLDVTATSTTGQSYTTSTTFNVANVTSSNQLLINIDFPNNTSGAFSGSEGSSFSGWAIDLTDKTTNDVTQVQIFIDRISAGYAYYNISRPDVCAAFMLAYSGGCPVGWEFFPNTLIYPNGTHSLDVTAYTTSGLLGTVSTTFTINNSSQSTGPTAVFIDYPNSRASTVVGVIQASGWAVANGDFFGGGVNILLDNAFIGNANYGTYRPDVCAIYSYDPACPNVGWSFLLDTTKLVDGPHTLTATAASLLLNGSISSAAVSTTFTVGNWTASGNPIVVSIDTPNTSTGNLSGSSVLVGGWAVDTDPGANITNVAISIDGSPVGNAAYGINRPDVCAVFPNIVSCPKVGWNFPLDTTVIPDGTHTLGVTVTSNGGQSYTTTTSITVLNNTASNPTQVDIDFPNASSGTVTGTVPIGGWALSTNPGDHVALVDVYVDNGFVSSATYGGSRPDVCAAFNLDLSNCPVGWNLLLDTTLFENGTHTLAIVANTFLGLNASESTSFTVYNP